MKERVPTSQPHPNMETNHPIVVCFLKEGRDWDKGDATFWCLKVSKCSKEEN